VFLLPEKDLLNAALADGAAMRLRGQVGDRTDLAANALQGDRAQSLGPGIDDDFTRPIRMDVLVSALPGRVPQAPQ